jgi:hypothetical protein
VFLELLEEQLGLYAYQGNVGRQRTYGLEGALRYDQPRYRVLANFSFSRAKRRYEPALKLGWEPYGLDQPLRVNLLAATTARRWNFGARLTVVSGNPIRLVPEGTRWDPEATEPPAEVLMRLPTYWQLDVRIDRTWNRSWGNVLLFFDLQNVTNHRNIEYRTSNPEYLTSNPGEASVYRYRDDQGLPIIPYIGVELAPH